MNGKKGTIVTDQQKADAPGCCGNGFSATPSLEAFARGEILFRNACIIPPSCGPSSGNTPVSRISLDSSPWPRINTSIVHRTAEFGRVLFEMSERLFRWSRAAGRLSLDPLLLLAEHISDWKGISGLSFQSMEHDRVVDSE